MDYKYNDYFNDIYDKTYKKLLLYVLKRCSNIEDVLDILQETYAEVYLTINKKGIDYIKNYDAFVIKIAKTKIFKHYKFTEKIRIFMPIFSLNNKDDNITFCNLKIEDYFIEDNIINNTLVEEISDYIKRKPIDIQRIFYLYYYFEMTISEISKQLSIKESTVKSKLYRTLKDIRRLYKGSGD